MKLSKFLVCAALGATISSIIVSCNKENSFSPSDQSVPVDESNVRTFGAVVENDATVGKVPLIVSNDFLNRSNDQVSSNLKARGKQDNTLPTVSINSPFNASIVSGAISVNISASDNVGVALVNLSIDGTTVASTSTSPYTFSWNSATVSNALHTLTATAKDAAGNLKTASVQVTVSNVTVGDITKPTVSITSPANGASVSGTISVAASASDNVGVSAVKYSVDGVLVATATSSPYSFSWNTTTVATGLRTLTATATDAAGNTGIASIQVTVNTTILPPPPSLPSSVQLIMPPVQNQGSEYACAVFSSVYAVRSAEQYYKSGASTYSYSTNIFSPEFVYNQTKFGDCSAGTGVTTALDFLVSNGVCTWQSMPYSSTNGCSLMPTSSQIAEAAMYKIASYSKVAVSDLTALKTVLVNKHPVVITIQPDMSFQTAGPGFIWKGYTSTPSVSHAIAICGYDDSKHAFKVINSWGTTWGDAGYSWIDYDWLPQTAFYYGYVINS